MSRSGLIFSICSNILIMRDFLIADPFAGDTRSTPTGSPNLKGLLALQ